MRVQLIALVFVVAGCASLTSPTGGPGAGDGGLPDGSLVVPDAGPPLFNLAPFVDGGTFTVNGTAVASIYWDGGVKTIVFPGTKDPRLTIMYPDKNHIDVKGDQNQDGVIDYTFTSVFDGKTLTETEQWDHTFGGVFDDVLQVAYTLGDAGHLQMTQSEMQLIDPDGGYALPDAGGSWVTTGSSQGTAAQGQACEPPVDTCAGFDGLPVNPPQAVQLAHHPNMAVPVNSVGACPAAETVDIAITANDSLDELYLCLAGEVSAKVTVPGDEFNFIAWAKLLVAEASLVSTNTHLYIDCNDTCDCTLAATLAYGCWSQGGVFPGQNIAINLRSPTVNPMSFTLSDAQLSETLTHEFLHFAGYLHVPEPGGSPEDHDLVYSCGRYCNLCQSHVTAGGANTPQSFHEDCATCADDEHRYLCGVLAIGPAVSPQVCASHQNGCDPACDMCGQAVYLDCNYERDTNLNAQESANGGEFCCEDSSCSNDDLPSCSGLAYVGEYDGCNNYPVGICASGH
jgi:hypothetical protein